MLPTAFLITPLSDPWPAPGTRRLAWVAADTGADGRPVGTCYLLLHERPGRDHLAEAELRVHPAERGRGAGTLLLAAAVAAAREEGRRTVTARADEGSPGAGFLAGRGFRTSLTLVHTRLALTDADPAALAAAVERPHPGYRLESWAGTVPDRFAESFAQARRAMDDMPTGDGTVPAVWDAGRVRAAARAVADRGDLLHTVVAFDTADGSVAAFTELVVPGCGTGDAQHYGTGVLPEHRGRGLARWIKSASVLHARTRHPALGGLLTDTAETNAPMRRVNEALGYGPTRREALCRLDLP
ncbi:GNAT family N-acetyltransferase [Streptomyces sp. NPDC047002]|uniref:GNAT family N-acetyltransferase n=1 Tax=Streptomyces sp. NPDC047002 TaxID=3155475 RepID=UPI0034528F62